MRSRCLYFFHEPTHSEEKCTFTPINAINGKKGKATIYISAPCQSITGKLSGSSMGCPVNFLAKRATDPLVQYNEGTNYAEVGDGKVYETQPHVDEGSPQPRVKRETHVSYDSFSTISDGAGDRSTSKSTPYRQFKGTGEWQSWSSSSIETSAADSREILFPSLGGFKDLFGIIVELPSETVYDHVNAAKRLGKLKVKVNQLQARRESYWHRQTANAVVAAPAAVLSLGVSAVLQGPMAVHQRNRLEQLERCLCNAIWQINKLRGLFKQFAESPEWNQAEGTTRINKKVFGRRSGIQREELEGEL